MTCSPLSIVVCYHNGALHLLGSLLMNDRLAESLRDHEHTLTVVAQWIRRRLEEDSIASWEQQLPRLTAAWERIGEPAYGIYNRELFRAIQDELDAEGFSCSPRLPGSLDFSEERWGPEDFRERR